MADLNRIQVGSYNIQDSIQIDNLKNDNVNSFISIEEFFKNNNKIILQPKEIIHFFNGVKIAKKLENEIYRIYNKDDSFIGIGTIQDGVLKRDIVLN